MRISESTLRQIIREEVKNLFESDGPDTGYTGRTLESAMAEARAALAAAEAMYQAAETHQDFQKAFNAQRNAEYRLEQLLKINAADYNRSFNRSFARP